MAAVTLRPFDFGRIVRDVQRVEERLLRATAALDAAGIQYAVIGGNAVANWISRTDESLAPFTRDVDILLSRCDLDAAAAALRSVGFIQRHAAGMEMFLDGPGTKAGDAVRVLFAGERVRDGDLAPLPQIDEAERGERYRVVSLEALVRMKLTSYRNKDRGHLDGMIDAGLIDASWIDRYPEELATRLKRVFDEHVPPLHDADPKQ